jgi:hypothetical protein
MLRLVDNAILPSLLLLCAICVVFSVHVSLMRVSTEERTKDYLLSVLPLIEDDVVNEQNALPRLTRLAKKAHFFISLYDKDSILFSSSFDSLALRQADEKPLHSSVVQTKSSHGELLLKLPLPGSGVLKTRVAVFSLVKGKSPPTWIVLHASGMPDGVS